MNNKGIYHPAEILKIVQYDYCNRGIAIIAASLNMCAIRNCSGIQYENLSIGTNLWILLLAVGTNLISALYWSVEMCIT